MINCLERICCHDNAGEANALFGRKLPNCHEGNHYDHHQQQQKQGWQKQQQQKQKQQKQKQQQHQEPNIKWSSRRFERHHSAVSDDQHETWVKRVRVSTHTQHVAATRSVCQLSRCQHAAGTLYLCTVQVHVCDTERKHATVTATNRNAPPGDDDGASSCSSTTSQSASTMHECSEHVTEALLTTSYAHLQLSSQPPPSPVMSPPPLMTSSQSSADSVWHQVHQSNSFWEHGWSHVHFGANDAEQFCCGCDHIARRSDQDLDHAQPIETLVDDDLTNDRANTIDDSARVIIEEIDEEDEKICCERLWVDRNHMKSTDKVTNRSHDQIFDQSALDFATWQSCDDTIVRHSSSSDESGAYQTLLKQEASQLCDNSVHDVSMTVSRSDDWLVNPRQSRDSSCVLDANIIEVLGATDSTCSRISPVKWPAYPCPRVVIIGAGLTEKFDKKLAIDPVIDTKNPVTEPALSDKLGHKFNDSCIGDRLIDKLDRKVYDPKLTYRYGHQLCDLVNDPRLKYKHGHKSHDLVADTKLTGKGDHQLHDLLIPIGFVRFYLEPCRRPLSRDSVSAGNVKLSRSPTLLGAETTGWSPCDSVMSRCQRPVGFRPLTHTTNARLMT